MSLEFHEGVAAVELAPELLGLGDGAGQSSEEGGHAAEDGENDHGSCSLVWLGCYCPAVERNMMELEGFSQWLARMYVMRPARGTLTNA